MSATKISARSSELPEKSPLPTPTSSPDQHIAYEHYLRLPELSKLWAVRQFPHWRNEPIVKPALQALEITFRLISITLTDPRPYTNQREWKRRLESLSTRQIELIAVLCEDDGGAGAPVVGLRTTAGVLTRDGSSQEVWKLPGTSPVVSRTSDASLLPRLAAWDKSEDVATAILFQIEAQMQRCHFTLGLGEPNLARKPNLEYDLIVKPSELHSLKRSPTEKNLNLPVNNENQVLFSIQQIVESWICCARELLHEIEERIASSDWEASAGKCWILERIWSLLADAEGMLILTDPDDFLRLKDELAIRSAVRSAGLLDITSRSRELKRTVPRILGVEVDRNGGPRVQQAAMGLFHSRRRGEAENATRIHLLQAFQAVEAAVKRFFFVYRQLVTAVMGSVEATGDGGVATVESSSEIFLEPPYFPSLDAAKTFLGEYWNCRLQH